MEDYEPESIYTIYGDIFICSAVSAILISSMFSWFIPDDPKLKISLSSSLNEKLNNELLIRLLYFAMNDLLIFLKKNLFYISSVCNSSSSSSLSSS